MPRRVLLSFAALVVVFVLTVAGFAYAVNEARHASADAAQASEEAKAASEEAKRATERLEVVIVENRRLIREAAKATTALCAKRQADLDTQKESFAFLKTHPDGINGISAEQIERGIQIRQTEIDAFAILNCPGQKE